MLFSFYKVCLALPVYPTLFKLARTPSSPAKTRVQLGDENGVDFFSASASKYGLSPNTVILIPVLV